MDEMLSRFAREKAWMKYFLEICEIPHGSGNTEKIADYLIAFAKEHNLPWILENCGNVIIRKPATPGCESAPGVVIQGHMDMVAVKRPSCTKDMETEGLNVALSKDGEYLFAVDTSLGGDDGIASAYGLAVLAADDIAHPAIELVATVDEETGMYGAKGLVAADVHGRRWLNIDSEDEGILLTGCAGGVTLCSTFSVVRETVSGSLLKILVTGCKGGHSGTEIHKHRENAILLLAELLDTMDCGQMLQPLWIRGGEKDNAIPTSAEMVICVNDYERLAICKAFELAVRKLQRAHQSQEPLVQYRLEETRYADEYVIQEGSYRVMNAASVRNILNFLLLVPFGVKEMSVEPEGLVETSNNVGIVQTKGDVVTVSASIRSMMEVKKELLAEKIVRLAGLCGGVTGRNSEYPGWQYREESKLRELWISEYRAMYGKDPEVMTIHAGLECGLILTHLPDVDAVSFGPNILDIHTTDERLEIASADRTWELLVRLLKRLGQE